MNTSTRLRGVFSPVITPFAADLAPDPKRMVRHCRWLLSQGVGLAAFGTNSEANSLSTPEKIGLLDALAEAGIPGERMMPGTGCCALSDTVELTRAAVRRGAGGVLMLPPFYYKGVSDDGLFASYSEVIQRVGDARLRIYLYHIPQVSNVPIGFDLIDRLLKAYPGAIAGIKDSSGDWNNTRGMLERFQPQGFDVFAGSESFLLANLRAGGAGCITATGNVNPGPIVRLFETWQGADADRQQEALDAVRASFASFPMIPALKAAVAHWADDEACALVRPPLVRLDAQQRSALLAGLEALDFSMPGL
ncbi:dihydrodipicolinate synthase family protein [Massilia niastensis]|uniref:dihydrodipicolinate synthase family protein n=1 Tax=Massilia niastensis TaxID=544911 RepID=UPI00036FF566|nr:dihydrodipicolinate synthase family protein [Massilia niastensis]